MKKVYLYDEVGTCRRWERIEDAYDDLRNWLQERDITKTEFEKRLSKDFYLGAEFEPTSIVFAHANEVAKNLGISTYQLEKAIENN